MNNEMNGEDLPQHVIDDMLNDGARAAMQRIKCPFTFGGIATLTREKLQAIPYIRKDAVEKLMEVQQMCRVGQIVPEPPAPRMDDELPESVIARLSDRARRLIHNNGIP